MVSIYDRRNSARKNLDNKRSTAKKNNQRILQTSKLKTSDAKRKKAAQANYNAKKKSSSSGKSGSSSSGSSGSSGSGGSGSGVSGSTATGTTGTGSGTGTGGDNASEVIENKYNDISGYFNPEEEEFIASTDTPTVRIFISREKVPDDEEEGETTSDGEEIESLEEAVRESVEISKLYKNNQDINNNNTSVIKTGDQKILAMKAISDIDFNSLNFGEDVKTEDVLKKLGLL